MDEMIDVNLTDRGVADLQSRHTVDEGRDSIVLTSSVLGLRGIGNVAHYIAAKHGVVGLIHNKMFYSVFMPDNPDPTRRRWPSAAPR